MVVTKDTQSNAQGGQSQTASQRIAVLALVAVNALWGLSFPMMKAVNQQVDEHFAVSSESASIALRMASAGWVIAIRFGLAFLILAVFLRAIIKKTNGSEWVAGFWIASFYFAGSMLQMIGLATISASRSGFLTSLTAVFAPILSCLIYRKMPSWNVWLGAWMAVAGVSLLTGVIQWSSTSFDLASDRWNVWTIGDTLTTLGALFFTGQVLAIEFFARRMNSSHFSSGMFAALIVLGLITFVAAAPLTSEKNHAGWTGLFTQPTFFVLLIILGGFCSFLSFYGMNKFQPAITAVQASVVYSLEPVFATSWALFIPGWISLATGIAYENENWSQPLLTGGTLILLANIVSLMPARSTNR